MLYLGWCQTYSIEIAFFDAVKNALTKFTSIDKRRTDEEKNSALKQIIGNAIVAEGVDDIFALVGLEKPKVGLLSPEFLEDFSSIKEKNLAVDWQVRDSVRAKLRSLVRRALRKWKYPPDKSEEAIDLCLKQAEVLSETWVYC